MDQNSSQFTLSYGKCNQCGKPYIYFGDVAPDQYPPYCTCATNPVFTPGAVVAGVFGPFSGTSGTPEEDDEELLKMAKKQAGRAKEKKTSLLDEMRRLGEAGNHVSVRYDPTRADYHWTVIVNNQRVTDTRNPTRALRKVR